MKAPGIRNFASYDPFDEFCSRSRQLAKFDEESDDTKAAPLNYDVVGQKVYEYGDFDATRLYYPYAVCREEGELFGMNY